MSERSVSPESELPRGVLAERLENNHHVLSIRWADGEETEMHFPTRGFDVVDPTTHRKLGHLTGEEAVAMVREKSSRLPRASFAWHPELEP